MNGEIESVKANGTAIVTLNHVGKAIGWALGLLALCLTAQFFAFRAFAAADRAQLREELGAQMRAEINTAMAKVLTQADKDALNYKLESTNQDLQRQISENRRILDRHLELFQSVRK